MKQQFTVVFTLLTLVLYSQKKPKITYYYYENMLISKKQYKELDVIKTYTTYVENDTAIFKNVFLNKKIELLNADQFLQVIEYLKKLIGSSYDVKKNYHNTFV